MAKPQSLKGGLVCRGLGRRESPQLKQCWSRG